MRFIDINDYPNIDLIKDQYSFASSLDSSVEKYNRFYIDEWGGTIYLHYYTYILDILDDTKQKWISIGSKMNLLPYFPTVIQNDISLLPEEFTEFIII